MIYTKLHEATRGTYARFGEESRALLAEAERSLPLYVFDNNVRLHLDTDALARSLSAMFAAGVVALPHKQVILELWAGMPDSRCFALVEQDAKDDHCFHFVMIGWEAAHGLTKIIRGRTLWQEALDPNIPPEPGETIVNMDTDEPVRPGENGWKIEWYETETDGEIALAKSLALAVTGGLFLLLLYKQVMGMEAEEVRPGKLNKSRKASGKPAIPDHRVIRIGHVYNSRGEKVKPTGDGGKMPIHMRAAHVRRQFHTGRWLAENRDKVPGETPGVEVDHHLVLIPAILVNFKEGADIRMPLPKVITA